MDFLPYFTALAVLYSTVSPLHMLFPESRQNVCFPPALIFHKPSLDARPSSLIPKLPLALLMLTVAVPSLALTLVIGVGIPANPPKRDENNVSKDKKNVPIFFRFFFNLFFMYSFLLFLFLNIVGIISEYLVW